MGLHVIAEAVLRIEHKLDSLLKHLKVKTMPMHFIGSQCPVCGRVIDYIVDVQHQVVVRRCDCKTGKVPSTIPLVPVPGIGDVKRSPAEGGGAASSAADPVSAGSEGRSKGPGGRQAR